MQHDISALLAFSRIISNVVISNIVISNIVISNIVVSKKYSILRVLCLGTLRTEPATVGYEEQPPYLSLRTLSKDIFFSLYNLYQSVPTLNKHELQVVMGSARTEPVNF